MGFFEFISIMCICLLGLTLVAFAAGPYILRWFFTTLDEWVDIIDSAKEKE